MQPQPPSPHSPYGPPQASPYQASTHTPNPYAAPQSDVMGGGAPMWGGQAPIEIEGKAIRFAKGTELPDRCLKCAEPAQGYRLNKTLHWHPPWIMIFIIVLGILGAVITAILAFVLRKSADARLPLCEKHRSLRMWGMVGGWVGALLGMGACTAGIPEESAFMMLAGAVLALASVIFGIVAQPFRLQKIDDTHVWLNVGEPFRLVIREQHTHIPPSAGYSGPPGPPPGTY